MEVQKPEDVNAVVGVIPFRRLPAQKRCRDDDFAVRNTFRATRIPVGRTQGAKRRRRRDSDRSGVENDGNRGLPRRKLGNRRS